MMSSALANAFLTGALVSSPVAAPLYQQGGNNVVHVDFKRSVVNEKSQPSASKAHNSLNEVGEWRSITTARLSALHRLESGWDGEGSERLSDDVLSKASRILDIVFSDSALHAPPAVVPCADGSMQLEWWLVDTRFELAIEASGYVEGWALDRTTGREMTAENTAAIELLSKWSGRLTADKLVLQA